MVVDIVTCDLVMGIEEERISIGDEETFNPLLIGNKEFDDH